jgi:hypothetical protein
VTVAYERNIDAYNIPIAVDPDDFSPAQAAKN